MTSSIDAPSSRGRNTTPPRHIAMPSGGDVHSNSIKCRSTFGRNTRDRSDPSASCPSPAGRAQMARRAGGAGGRSRERLYAEPPASRALMGRFRATAGQSLFQASFCPLDEHKIELDCVATRDMGGRLVAAGPPPVPLTMFSSQ